MKKSILTILILCFCFAAMAQKNTPKSYIEKFKGDAIKIMHETGVPASIVLGVAMHESACGNSILAKNLNNQFGVKGDSRIVYYRNKKKVSTLYKRYGSVYDSYQDFARIMTERTEFSDLIAKLTHFDYSGWAHGIQNHGYASDHKWSKGVLKIIEKYKLYDFDEHPENQQMAQNNLTSK
jgi:flagellum-specific peptidoglycan hydrolase FlgJ